MRVVIVSATMGEGHNATGRALGEAVCRIWPDATVAWLDTLDVMGPGVGPVFRWIYRTNIRSTPWLYEFFYRSLFRHRWFATASKRFVGAWCGRRLAAPLTGLGPDLVLSTYPLGTAGLAWLRRHRGLDVPIAAWVSDFTPHPFWVYRSVEANVVMHPLAAAVARRCVPDAEVVVSAPPVSSAFRPNAAVAARTALGLPCDAFLALVSCGSLGFGNVLDTARELLAADPSVVPVVVCGRNEALRRRVAALAAREPRLRALGWSDQLPELTAAADVVVTNAGGATSLEALACGRPVLMHRPIAAHGRANAELMERAGLAVVCTELTTTVRRLLARPERLRELSDSALRHCSTSPALEVVLRSVARRTPGTVLRPSDALFAHVATSEVPQQIGAVLVFDAKPDGRALSRSDAAALLEAAPGRHVRLDTGSAWRRPTWRSKGTSSDGEGTLRCDVVDEVPVGAGGLAEAMDVFFSLGLDPTVEVCRGRLVTGLAGNGTALMIKLHHAAADGIAMCEALVGHALGQPPLRPAAPDRARLGRAHQLARGLWTLARSGRAPRVALTGPVASPARHHAVVDLPAAQVRVVARRFAVSSSELVLALVAEGVHRLLGEGAPERVRAMVPVSFRETGTAHRLGNYTGATSVDLLTGPMPLPARVAATQAAVRAQMGSDAPASARLVVHTLGVLPPWLHRRLARLMYRGTWFNLVVSVMPGARPPVRWRGALVRTVYPVLPLAPGVGVAVGVITWANSRTVCVTTPAEWGGRGDRLATDIAGAFGELVEGHHQDT